MNHLKDNNRGLLLEKALEDLELMPVFIEGKQVKPSQCYRLSIQPLHVLYNTNCPNDLREKIQSILLEYQVENRFNATDNNNARKILVHNSDDDLMNLIKQALQAKGYEASFTRHREDLPGIMSEFEPDLMLLDNAQENALGDLQGHPRMPITPVVLMTGQQGKESIHVWPVSAVIRKPFTLSQLTHVIDKVLLENKNSNH